MPLPRFLPLQWHERPVDEMRARAELFRADLARRRTVRHFSDRPVPRDIIETCLRTAGTAPSGANLQPWYFVAVSDPRLKTEIRAAAEQEERDFYQHRAPPEWLEALAPLGTDENKPYLETAPWLIAVFSKRHGERADGTRVPHYYVTESVGLATGVLIAALHHAGLVSLTHTPSPMGFLNTVLDRPASERAFLLLVTGYPAADAIVPDLSRKSLEEIAEFRTPDEERRT